jgi:F420H(2)-dependent quinone reductase
MYQQVGDDLGRLASKAGAPTNPDWDYNLRANPNVESELGTETIPVQPGRSTPRTAPPPASVCQLTSRDTGEERAGTGSVSVEVTAESGVGKSHGSQNPELSP